MRFKIFKLPNIFCISRVFSCTIYYFTIFKFTCVCMRNISLIFSKAVSPLLIIIAFTLNYFLLFFFFLDLGLILGVPENSFKIDPIFDSSIVLGVPKKRILR